MRAERPDRRRFRPILARTRTLHRAVGPAAYDCVKVICVRDGSAIVFSEFGQKPVTVGDILILGSNTLCGTEPEGHLTLTAISLDPDYLIDQVFWQYCQLLKDRLEAQGFAETMYAEPAQLLRLGETRVGAILPWLDELVSLSVGAKYVDNFNRIQALWFSIAHVIAPFVKCSPVRVSQSQRAHIRPTLPRDRRYAPLREEVRKIAELLKGSPERHWTLGQLASNAHLSPSQFTRVFADAYGKTPAAYLTMVRAEALARLLRETDLPVEAAMYKVGWHSRGHAARLFREHVGVSPAEYRRLDAETC